MSGEAVITYMGYRKYVQAGKNALEAGKQASTALWIAIISIGLTIGSIWVSVFAKEIHDTFLPGSQEQSDTEQCLPQGGPAGSHTLLLPTNMDSSKIDTTVQPTLQVDSFGAVDSVLLKH